MCRAHPLATLFYFRYTDSTCGVTSIPVRYGDFYVPNDRVVVYRCTLAVESNTGSDGPRMRIAASNYYARDLIAFIHIYIVSKPRVQFGYDIETANVVATLHAGDGAPAMVQFFGPRAPLPSRRIEELIGYGPMRDTCAATAEQRVLHEALRTSAESSEPLILSLTRNRRDAAPARCRMWIDVAEVAVYVLGHRSHAALAHADLAWGVLMNATQLRKYFTEYAFAGVLRNS